MADPSRGRNPSGGAGGSSLGSCQSCLEGFTALRLLRRGRCAATLSHLGLFFQPDEFRERLEQAVRATLKSDNVEHNLYGEDERLLMVWYVYLFLNRGKPSTHILALANIGDEEYEENLPQPIVQLRKKVETKLANDPFSQLPIDEQA